MLSSFSVFGPYLIEVLTLCRLHIYIPKSKNREWHVKFLCFVYVLDKSLSNDLRNIESEVLLFYVNLFLFCFLWGLQFIYNRSYSPSISRWFLSLTLLLCYTYTDTHDLFLEIYSLERLFQKYIVSEIRKYVLETSP